MLIDNKFHLSYCTNIHPGESWEETFLNLAQYVPVIKKEISPDQHFGIGLRLSDRASQELLEKNHLEEFKNWLDEHNVYVFTLNGFPYGDFHQTEVKDNVHKPDWSKKNRLTYTRRLFFILSQIAPQDIDAGISTSPISYKPWYKGEDKKIDEVYKIAATDMIDLVTSLYNIKKEFGKTMHLDIEPEPDGFIENTDEIIAYFNDYLIPIGLPILHEKHGLEALEAERVIKEHIQVCFDICHYSVRYEVHAEALEKLGKEKIQVGKVQISSAIEADLTQPNEALETNLQQFSESTYLHQVTAKDPEGKLTYYDDMEPFLMSSKRPDFVNMRTHFHVPLFTEEYESLQSTQKDVIDVLKLFKDRNFTDQLEIETYTWDVLPSQLRINLTESIVRELKWTLNQLGK